MDAGEPEPGAGGPHLRCLTLKNLPAWNCQCQLIRIIDGAATVKDSGAPLTCNICIRRTGLSEVKLHPGKL